MVLNTEQLQILLKSARGSSVVDLIKQALLAPSIFHFECILLHQNVKDLCSENSQNQDMQKLMNTLRLFAYGCYEDFTTEPQKFVPLGECEIEKLRLLSLMSIAIKNCAVKYDF